MLAARTGDVASLKSLLAAGSNVNARETRTGTTAVDLGGDQQSRATRFACWPRPAPI